MRIVCFCSLSCLFFFFLFFFFLEKKKGNYKLTVVATLACSVPQPLTRIQGELEKNARQAGKQSCDSRPGRGLFIVSMAEAGLQERGQPFPHLCRPVEKAEVRGT